MIIYNECNNSVLNYATYYSTILYLHPIILKHIIAYYTIVVYYVIL